MGIDPHIFRVLSSFLPILTPRKPPKLNVHFRYLPPPATEWWGDIDVSAGVTGPRVEAEIVRQRVSIADRKVFARLESFCAYLQN